MSNFVVGIDLGTTNTCVSIYLNGKIKLLENAEGKQVTPSFLFFADIEKDKVIVGPYAKKMADNKPEFGVYEFKRFIGRDFEDCAVQNNLQYYPFTVEESAEKNCLIDFEQNGREYKKSVEEITAILLRKVKKDVSAKLMCPVDKAVITVPAYFNHLQREATLKAAKMAGFTVLKLLNEPTAAALNYFQERPTTDSKSYYMVYDLGGGTFDVAVLKKKAGNDIEIVAVDGDSHLGGRDFDVLITDYVCDYLRKEYQFDAKQDKRLMKRLQTKSEEAKKALSFAEETDIILEGFVSGQDAIIISVTRKQFESMAQSLFEKSIEIMELCLKSAKIEKNQIKNVILSGGSTRIPKIGEMVSRFFNEIPLNKFVNPDLCVANGASVQAALLSTNAEQHIGTMEIKEVTPLSLGATDRQNRMSVIIKRNTPIPARGEHSFCNPFDKQESICFKIYEGERTDARKNRLLGEFTITNLTPAPPTQCHVTLCLLIDQNGILTATAKEEYRNNVKEATIEYTRGARGDADIKNSLHEAEKNRDEDIKFTHFANKKRYLLDYCSLFTYNMKEKKLIKMHKYSYELSEDTLNTAKWLELPDESDLDELIRQVERQLNPLAKRYNFQYMPVKGCYF